MSWTLLVISYAALGKPKRLRVLRVALLEFKRHFRLEVDA